MHYLKPIPWLYSDVLFWNSTSIANQVSAAVVVGRTGFFRAGLQINKARVEIYTCSPSPTATQEDIVHYVLK